MDSLSAIATINLWEDNIWLERRGYLFDTLKENDLTAEKGVILSLQEVKRVSHDPLLELAEALNFNNSHVYYFPTMESGNYGLGVISNLPVIREEFQAFSFDINDPYEFGQRGIGMLEFELKQGRMHFGVTHLSVSRRMQYIQGRECIIQLKNFAVDGINVSEDTKEKLKNLRLIDLCSYTDMALTGDFNASPDTPLYELYTKTGLHDLTKNIQKTCHYTWPSSIDWFIEVHKKHWGSEPPYNVKRLQRWMDYIWTCKFDPKEVRLLGQKPRNKTYVSDHLIPVAYF